MKNWLVKISLIGFGLLLSVFIIEISLQTIAFGIRLKHGSSKLQALDPDEFRILCIGESTTDGIGRKPYPLILQEKLRAKGVPVTVFNKGLPAQDSRAIASQIDAWLELYKPQLVISMMGINDRPNALVYSSPNEHNFLDNFRTYRLIRTIWHGYLHENSTLQEKNLRSESKTINILQNALESPTSDDFIRYNVAQRLKRVYAESRDTEKYFKALETRLSIKPSLADVQEFINIAPQHNFSAEAIQRKLKNWVETSSPDTGIKREFIFYLANDNLPQALNAAIELVQSDAGDALNYVLLAKLYERIGRKEDQGKTLRQAIRAKTNIKQAYSALSGYLELQKEYQQQAEILEMALTDFPDELQFLSDLVKVYQLDSRNDKLESRINVAFKKQPYNFNFYRILLNHYLKSGNFARALEMAKVMVVINSLWPPGLENNLNLVALNLITELEGYEVSKLVASNLNLPSLDQITKPEAILFTLPDSGRVELALRQDYLEPSVRNALRWRLRNRYNDGLDRIKEIALLRENLSENPNDQDAYDLASLISTTPERTSLVEMLSKFTAENPTAIKSLLLLAENIMREQPERAEALANQALQVDPGDFHAYKVMATLKMQQMQPDVAEAMLRTSCINARDKVAACSSLANFLAEQGKSAEVEQVLLTSIQSTPDTENMGLVEDLTRLYSTQGLTKKSVNFLRKIFPKTRNQRFILKLLGNSLFELRYYQEAIRVYKWLTVLEFDAVPAIAEDNLEQLATSLLLHDKPMDKITDFANNSEVVLGNLTPFTVEHYAKVLRSTEAHAAKLIAMQYPTKSIEELKMTLPSSYHGPFVENKENFERALGEHGYDYVFIDKFGGSFGHCTDFGNDLIVENLIPVVSSELLQNKKI